MNSRILGMFLLSVLQEKKKKDMYKVEVQEGFGGQRKCIPVGDFCWAYKKRKLSLYKHLSVKKTWNTTGFFNPPKKCIVRTRSWELKQGNFKLEIKHMLLLFSLCFTEMVIKLWGRLHCSRKMVDVISGDFQMQPIYFLKVVFWRNTSNGGLNIRGNWMEYKYLKQKLSVDELISSPGLKCMKIQIALLQCVCFLHLIGFLSGLKKL